MMSRKILPAERVKGISSRDSVVRAGGAGWSGCGVVGALVGRAGCRSPPAGIKWFIVASGPRPPLVHPTISMRRAWGSVGPYCFGMDSRELAKRQKPVSGSVEDYLMPEDDPDAPSEA